VSIYIYIYVCVCVCVTSPIDEGSASFRNFISVAKIRKWEMSSVCEFKNLPHPQLRSDHLSTRLGPYNLVTFCEHTAFLHKRFDTCWNINKIICFCLTLLNSGPTCHSQRISSKNIPSVRVRNKYLSSEHVLRTTIIIV
jgi:hypothetical protein